ncbi:MAG: diguanylate cyclase domain-containing protein [Pseudomonadota bacterium]
MTDQDTSKLVRLTDRFREFHRLNLSRYDAYSELYADYLRTGMRLFNMPVGIVSRISDGQYTILAVEPGTTDFAAGDSMPLGQTYCSAVVSEEVTMAVSHAGRDPALCGHPAYRQMGLEAYLAAPIRVNGEIHGTLNFTAPEAREYPFDETDVELIELMASRIGQVIEQDLLDRDKQQALIELRENTELFESAFEYAAIGMALLSPAGRWLRVNRAATTIFGYSEEELLTIDFQTLTHPDDLDTDLAFVREMLAGKRDTFRMEKRYFHKAGHEIQALLSVSMVREEDGTPKYFVSQIQDITAQKHAEAELLRRQKELESLNRKLDRLSTTDPLTQLANRRALDERLQEELHRSARTGDPLSLLMVDIDHFKNYNDTHGHPEGDVALRELADAMKRVARKHDIVVRLGGEEFTLLLPHTDEAGCRIVAQRLSRAVSELQGLEAPITVSTGGATLEPGMGTVRTADGEALLKKADEALYQAKQAGRNRHCQASRVTH